MADFDPNAAANTAQGGGVNPMMGDPNSVQNMVGALQGAGGLQNLTSSNPTYSGFTTQTPYSLGTQTGNTGSFDPTQEAQASALSLWPGPQQQPQATALPTMPAAAPQQQQQTLNYVGGTSGPLSSVSAPQGAYTIGNGVYGSNGQYLGPTTQVAAGQQMPDSYINNISSIEAMLTNPATSPYQAQQGGNFINPMTMPGVNAMYGLPA